MEIADIAVTTLPMNEVSRYTSQNAVKTIGVEFDAMFIQALLRSGNADETDTGSTDMSLWNDLFAHALAQELAAHGGFEFSQTPMTVLTPSTGEKR